MRYGKICAFVRDEISKFFVKLNDQKRRRLSLRKCNYLNYT